MGLITFHCGSDMTALDAIVLKFSIRFKVAAMQR